jgi:hypothetical protein
MLNQKFQQGILYIGTSSMQFTRVRIVQNLPVNCDPVLLEQHVINSGGCCGQLLRLAKRSTDLQRISGAAVSLTPLTGMPGGP